MDNKEKNRKKKLKVILVICIDDRDSGRRIVGLHTSCGYCHTGKESECVQVGCIKLTVEKAGQNIRKAFQNKKITFQEDGRDVYQSMGQLGYSLDQDIQKLH